MILSDNMDLAKYVMKIFKIQYFSASKNLGFKLFLRALHNACFPNLKISGNLKRFMKTFTFLRKNQVKI